MGGVTVSRFVEFDTGHRVARHESKCSNLHGHRYRLTVEVGGPVKNDGSPEHGMVIDFARVKAALMEVHDLFDHRFVVGSDDPLLPMFDGMPGLVVFDEQPTAENLAAFAAGHLSVSLSPLTIVSVTLQETTACEARWTP
jgi:6-pyruvoyltetrahydropterin/6-carboxytetrahydropterin synthase